MSNLEHGLSERQAEPAVAVENYPAYAARFGLTKSLARLLELMVETDLVMPSMVKDRLGYTTDLKMMIYRMRPVLYGFEIIVKHRHDIGYWLEPAMKERVRKIMSDLSIKPRTARKHS